MIISIVLAVGAVLASKDRRKALIDLGLGVIIANAIVWILFARIGAKQTEDRPAAAAIFEVLRDSLLRALAISALIAAIVVLVEWYRGPRWHPATVGPADTTDTADIIPEAGTEPSSCQPSLRLYSRPNRSAIPSPSLRLGPKTPNDETRRPRHPGGTIRLGSCE